MTSRLGRRGFLASLIGAATLDPERLLWAPGRKTISIPAPIWQGRTGVFISLIQAGRARHCAEVINAEAQFSCVSGPDITGFLVQSFENGRLDAPSFIMDSFALPFAPSGGDVYLKW